MAGGSQKVSQTEFARIMGLTKGRVSQLISAGKLDGAITMKGKRRLIDVEKAKAVLEDRQDQIQVQSHALSSGKKSTAGLESDESNPDYLLERARKEYWNRKKIQLECMKTEGGLVDRTEVQRQAAAAGKLVSSALLGLGSRLKSRFDLPLDVVAAINGEVDQILKRLSEEIRRI